MNRPVHDSNGVVATAFKVYLTAPPTTLHAEVIVHGATDEPNAVLMLGAYLLEIGVHVDRVVVEKVERLLLPRFASENLDKLPNIQDGAA